MKNAMKKISAIAMAFTLLGSGTAIIYNAAPKFDNSITASAASPNYTSCYWWYSRPSSNKCYSNGSSGSQVRWIQAAMNYYFGNSRTKLDVDGQYGPKTAAAVKAFQSSFNNKYSYGFGRLSVDGVFGPCTYSAMCIIGY